MLFSLKMLLLVILFSIKVSTQPNIFSTHFLKEGLELFPKKIKDSWKFTKQFWKKSSKKDDTKVEPDGITDVELPCKSIQCTNEICATKVSRKKRFFSDLILIITTIKFQIGFIVVGFLRLAFYCCYRYF